MVNPSLGLSSIPPAPAGFKSGFVALLGRTNVGKSTLLNALVGQKIAITSPVSQTTRNRLRGIVTTAEAQIILVDTPGIHKPHHELGKILVRNAEAIMGEVDLALLVADCGAPLGNGDRHVARLLAESQTPVLLGLNQADRQTEESAASLDQGYQELAQTYGWDWQKFSALTGEGVTELQGEMIRRLEPGPYYYPPDLVTDQPERFIIAELIREQILHLTRQEVPHSVAIAIEKIAETPKLTEVFASITVERASQKGIIIGKQGSMLQAIGSAARLQIQKLIAGDVFLKLFVKIEPKWRQSRRQLLEFGYRLED
ncbi:MAG: GTPase Era [Cyanobacteriota bacterium]|nr:GTPase Era [Cyanobacteriota bacterium]